MARLPLTNDEIREWLDEEWSSALQVGHERPDLDPEVDALANSNVVSIRYALVTQMLGKIADPARSLTALQLEAGGEGAWNARSFSTSVVVPWVDDNHQVLGTSADPYVSKPLRRVRLEHEMDDVRAKDEWGRLVALFDRLENAPLEDLRNAFRLILRSLVRRLAAQEISYAVPRRASMAQMETMLVKFLNEPSGGLRPLAVSAALFTTLGRAFSLFSEVKSQGINEADVATGMSGDVMCYDDNGIRLVIEVKDCDLTLSHVQAASLKAKQSGEELSNLLFAVPRIREVDRDDISALSQREWASGLNIYTINLHDLSRSAFVLLDEQWRVRFLIEVGDELDRRQNQQARKAWHDILQELP